MVNMKRWTWIPLVLVVVMSSLLVGGCTSSGSDIGELELAPLSDMPSAVQSSPVNVQRAYRFAIANPEIVSEVPCYCGCGPMGHNSNYACYVQDDSQVEEGESLIFDNHALGCSICVDITLDTMRLLEEGKSLDEIRKIIDDKYARFGPSNMP